MKADHSILKLCANLQVSPSGYCAWEQRPAAPGLRAREDAALATEVAVMVLDFHGGRRAYAVGSFGSVAPFLPRPGRRLTLRGCCLWRLNGARYDPLQTGHMQLCNGALISQGILR
jgi:hypothetical protein